MEKENINWELVDQMREIVRKDEHGNLSREQALNILVHENLLNPNGMPTKKAVEHGLVGYASYKPEPKEFLNRKLSYRQLLASIPMSMMKATKENKEKIPQDKYNYLIHGLTITINHLLHSSLSQFNEDDWESAIYSSYKIYRTLSKGGVSPKDERLLYNKYQFLISKYLKFADAPRQAQQLIQAMVKDIQHGE